MKRATLQLLMVFIWQGSCSIYELYAQEFDIKVDRRGLREQCMNGQERGTVEDKTGIWWSLIFEVLAGLPQS